MAFERKSLVHTPPDWVDDGAIYFITICLEDRNSRALIDPTNAAVIKKAASFYHCESHWWIELIVLMPDHLHALISFNQKVRPMSECIRAWKAYLKRSAGIQWQRGYFDHRLRTLDAAREKASYIRNNPVRAGLIEPAEDWKYAWSAADLG